MSKLTQEEKELLESYETEEWISVANPKKLFQNPLKR